MAYSLKVAVFYQQRYNFYDLSLSLKYFIFYSWKLYTYIAGLLWIKLNPTTPQPTDKKHTTSQPFLFCIFSSSNKSSMCHLGIFSLDLFSNSNQKPSKYKIYLNTNSHFHHLCGWFIFFYISSVRQGHRQACYSTCFLIFIQTGSCLVLPTHISERTHSLQKTNQQTSIEDKVSCWLGSGKAFFKRY